MGAAHSSRKAINFHHRRYVLWLVIAFTALTLALGIAPKHRHDWILENVLVLPALGVLVAIYHFMPFSRLSWTLVFVLAAQYLFCKSVD